VVFFSYLKVETGPWYLSSCNRIPSC